MTPGEEASAIATRSIRYANVGLGRARKIGLRMARAARPPEGVANYATMLMMMVLRKAKLVLAQAAPQDSSLQGKLGRVLSSHAVGMVGSATSALLAFLHAEGSPLFEVR